MILKRIQSDTSLAKVYNMYMSKLFQYDHLNHPATEMSMKDYNGDMFPYDYKLNKSRAFFELKILDTSLNRLYDSVIEAISLIENYFTEYNSDCRYFATSERIKSLNEYGGGDISDWDDNNQVIYKDDEESIKDYTFVRELGRFIAIRNSEGYRGEIIGASNPEDFIRFSTIIINESLLSPSRLMSEFFNKEFTLHIPEYDANGNVVNMIAEGLADRVEREINVDIVNESIVSEFNFTLKLGQRISERYSQLDNTKDNKSELNAILLLLKELRDLKSK